MKVIKKLIKNTLKIISVIILGLFITWKLFDIQHRIMQENLKQPQLNSYQQGSIIKTW